MQGLEVPRPGTFPHFVSGDVNLRSFGMTIRRAAVSGRDNVTNGCDAADAHRYYDRPP